MGQVHITFKTRYPFGQCVTINNSRTGLGFFSNNNEKINIYNRGRGQNSALQGKAFALQVKPQTFFLVPGKLYCC